MTGDQRILLLMFLIYLLAHTRYIQRAWNRRKLLWRDLKKELR